MTMHGDLSPEARDRAGRTVSAATVYEQNAPLIVENLADVPDEHVLVVVVDAAHQLAGMHHIAQADLVMRVPELETAGGWAMVFSPSSTVEDVRRRAQDMASIAEKRVAAIDRIIKRREAG